MGSYEKRWQGVLEHVARAAHAADRDPAGIRVIAVGKTFGPEAIRAVHAAGARAFGENYVQEALGKIEALRDLPDIEWHFIGPLQSNKTAPVAAHFDWVHTIDRLKIAQRLSAARTPERPPLDLCIQVNISGEATKSGVAPDDALALARSVATLPHVRLRGFMGIAEPTPDVARQRAQFRRLRECLERSAAQGLAVDTLSMGMTADLDAAIAEGATLVRIGTAIFGERVPRPAVAVGELAR
jgi:pyridoxal phosphate enzyme (YggS family)